MKKTMLVLAFFMIVAIPAFAFEPVIFNGSDLWTTVGDGSTYSEFSQAPIPAGFFCPTSAPFTGRIAFKGMPVATGKPGALGTTDTIVQRLDDAVFNKKGVASTRVQVRALSLESIAPVKTSCGQFKVVATLDNGPQPITRMRIVRENEKGGRFQVPLSLNVRLTFTRVDAPASAQKLELRQNITFATTPQPWRLSSRPVPEEKGYILVDTDGDRVADTYLPGTSNFTAGQAPDKVATTTTLTAQPAIDPVTGYNHYAPAHRHIVYTTTIDTVQIVE